MSYWHTGASFPNCSELKDKLCHDTKNIWPRQTWYLSRAPGLVVDNDNEWHWQVTSEKVKGKHYDMPTTTISLSRPWNTSKHHNWHMTLRLMCKIVSMHVAAFRMHNNKLATLLLLQSSTLFRLQIFVNCFNQFKGNCPTPLFIWISPICCILSKFLPGFIW